MAIEKPADFALERYYQREAAQLFGALPDDPNAALRVVAHLENMVRTLIVPLALSCAPVPSAGDQSPSLTAYVEAAAEDEGKVVRFPDRREAV